jgi:hypothetical protein
MKPQTPFLILFLLASPMLSFAQERPYIGFVYPAGGQRGTNLQIRLGGQGIAEVQSVLVTGAGVTASLAENYRRLDNQELQLLNEQAQLLKRKNMSEGARSNVIAGEESMMMAMASSNMMQMQSGGATNEPPPEELTAEAARALVARIEKRTSEYVPNPASAAIASLVLVDIAIAPDAEPGEREIRLVTLKGVSNPLAFHVGVLPEYSKKPMVSASQQVLGKEAQALRKRVPGDDEATVALPCAVNGQIASSEVNRYRFEARQGQRLVFTTLGRQLVPFIADAVPGWVQPVLALYDSSGKEVAYNDDYRFKPDPTLFYEVPRDGEYALTIRDSLYRGREDFVYRITMGELPFITSVFPLGGRADSDKAPAVKGWNLKGAALTTLAPETNAGITWLSATNKGLVSNRVPFARDVLSETSEKEPNNTLAAAQKVALPILINGRINRPDDWDVFEFAGKSNETVVAEVFARRLDSPLDSVLKLTDAAGNLLAFNDDHEDLAAGINTHQADSYLSATLPADGRYFVHLGDTARQGGEEYGYRLRLSAPRPDFELRVVPSSLSLRSNSSGTLTVYAKRKDGFAGPIKLALKDPPLGFSNYQVTLQATQAVTKINLKTSLRSTPEPVCLTVAGTAKIGDQSIVHEAIPAEDRMQAFLWRSLVPARELRAMVFDPGYQPPATRVAHLRPRPAVSTNAPPMTNIVVSVTNLVNGSNVVSLSTNTVPIKPRFTKEQVAGRLRQLKRLYEEGMLTEAFYCDKVAECEADL